MSASKPIYYRYRFPSEIISHGVWLYHRFSLSFREEEDLLAERGIQVSYETIRQWRSKFGPEYAAQRILSGNGRIVYEYSTRFPPVCQLGRGDEDAAPWVAGHAIDKSMTIDCESSSAVPATSA